MRVALWMILSLLGAATAAYGIVCVLTERYLSEVSAPVAFSYPISEAPANIDAGRHLARTRGCFGCHGEQLQGRVFEEEWALLGRSVAPNLAQAAREQDSASLAAAIRDGIGFNGKALWSMPSYNFVRLSDADVANLIAFFRATPIVPTELPSPILGLTARLMMLFEDEEHMAALAQQVPALKLSASAADPQLVAGEYLAMTTCNECHGLDLRGQPGGAGRATPDLAMVAAYPEADFRRLMKTGVGLGNRELGLMSTVAKGRFASFTDEEVGDLYRFLGTLASALESDLEQSD